MENGIAKILNQDELRILKKIVVITEIQNSEIELGIILYTRILNDVYNLKQNSAFNNDSKKSLETALKDNLSQIKYPSDKIDTIIYDSVKKRFPKSIVINDKILSHDDLVKIKEVKKLNSFKATMHFAPELSKVINFSKYINRRFSSPFVEFQIYSNYKHEFFSDNIFYANYEIDDTDIFDNLKQVFFE